MQTAAPDRSSAPEKIRPEASVQFPAVKYALVVPVTLVVQFCAFATTVTL
jgi:hypothetical protein